MHKIESLSFYTYFFNIVFSKNISCSFFAGKALCKKVQAKTCNFVETRRKPRAVEEIVAREKIIELSETR